ncbi:MAG: penicillin-binding protein activator LpoB [Geobacter sp.]|nr:MAG: penicillin-binding protein activator LpoB [Geobacter sp.]
MTNPRKMTAWNLVFCMLLVVAALLLPGCGGKTGVYLDSTMDFGAVHSVAVMPLANLTREQQAADRVRDVFSTALMASSGIYVTPPGEVMRGIVNSGIANPSSPTADEVVKFCKATKTDAVFTGVIREYGDLRSGTATANVISMSMQMIEGQTGKVIWSGDSTKGGISMSDRLLGGGGQPLNVITEKAVYDLLGKLF